MRKNASPTEGKIVKQPLYFSNLYELKKRKDKEMGVAPWLFIFS